YRGHPGVADADLGAVLVEDDAVLGDLAHDPLDRILRVAHRHEDPLAEERLGFDPPHGIQVRGRAGGVPRLQLRDATHYRNAEPAAAARRCPPLARERARAARGRRRGLAWRACRQWANPAGLG